MPLVHAANNSSIVHCAMVEGEQNHDKKTTHNMNLCTKIVQEVLEHHGDIHEIPSSSAIMLPFLLFQEKHTSKNIQKSQLVQHKTDPPYFTSHHLV